MFIAIFVMGCLMFAMGSVVFVLYVIEFVRDGKEQKRECDGKHMLNKNCDCVNNKGVK